MYQPRTFGYIKSDQAMRWALPDRVFFACGACHILAHAFLERDSHQQHEITWIKPASGHTGNHIFVGADDWVFDYHGYSRRDAYLKHIWKRARHFWPGWDAALIRLSPEVLTSEEKSRQVEGLWLRAPDHLHDALPRARKFLAGFQNRTLLHP